MYLKPFIGGFHSFVAAWTHNSKIDKFQKLWHFPHSKFFRHAFRLVTNTNTMYNISICCLRDMETRERNNFLCKLWNIHEAMLLSEFSQTNKPEQNKLDEIVKVSPHKALFVAILCKFAWWIFFVGEIVTNFASFFFFRKNCKTFGPNWSPKS